MNKAVKVNKKSQPSYKVISFWSIIVLLTLVFVGFVIVKFVQNTGEINKLESMNNLSGQQVFEQTGTYYVFVYSKVGVTTDKAELTKLEDLKETILNYLSFAKKNPSELKMYGLIVDSFENYSILIEGSSDTNVVGKNTFADLKIHKEDLPILLKIQDGKVSAAYLTQNSIREEIQKAINN